MPVHVHIASRAIRWLYAIVIAGDLMFIALTAASDLELSWVPAILMNQGDLKEEGVLGVWYSSTLLFLNWVACMLVAFRGRRSRRGRAAWLVVALGFLVLSADETAQFHERLGKRMGQAGMRAAYVPPTDPAFIWLVPAAPAAAVFVAALLVASRVWNRDYLRSRNLAMAGVVCWVAVLVAEFGESQLILAGMKRSLQGAIEEGLELAGSTLFLIGFIEYLRSPGTSLEPAGSSSGWPHGRPTDGLTE